MTDSGIVVRGHGKSFVVSCRGEEITCEIRGKIKYETDSATPVAVGDDVVISRNKYGSGVIEKVEERRSMFFRPAKGSNTKKQIIAANIDQLAAVASVKEPDLKPGLVDRFLIAAEIGNLNPIVVINKIDLDRPPFLDEIRQEYSRLGIPAFFISAKTGENIEELEKALMGCKTVFAGHSGVGKSTILNRLIPGLNLPVGEVSRATSRGVHTTSLIQLFGLPKGGYAIDSPGLKVLGLWEVDKEHLDEYFPEMQRLRGRCRFTGCSHTHEPDCAIKEAVEKRNIAEFRYRSYLIIYQSLQD
jgi:ribosome biogenesis GTPase